MLEDVKYLEDAEMIDKREFMTLIKHKPVIDASIDPLKHKR